MTKGWASVSDHDEEEDELGVISTQADPADVQDLFDQRQEYLSDYEFITTTKKVMITPGGAWC